MQVNPKPSGKLLKTINIFKELGYNFGPDSIILDFGCGSGKMVNELRDMGVDAYGCGTRFITENNINLDVLMENDVIRAIDLKHYSIPFKDNTFDIIFSHSVFEHVQNYAESIAELARVLKPDGVCLHFFPSRLTPIDTHTFVPFASIIQTHWWLYFWTLFGIRNEWTKGLNAKETSIKFLNYLKNETNYLTKKQLIKEFKAQFKDVMFCENLSIKYALKKGKNNSLFLKVVPFVNKIYSTFRGRVILTRLPLKT